MKKSLHWQIMTCSCVLLLQCFPVRAGSADGGVIAAARNVMKVGEVSRGSGSIVLVVQESHASRLGQVEEAIFLSRAYADPQLQLRDIAIEGYLNDRSKIPFDQLHRTGEFRDRLDVAAGKLERGEIYSGEFMAMVFSDVRLIPTEKASEHDIRVPTNAENTLSRAKTLLELKTLSPEDRVQAMELDREFRNETDTNAQRRLAEQFRQIRSKSPLAKKWGDKEAGDTNDISIEADIAMLNDIKSEADGLGVATIKTNGTISAYGAYLRTRSAASLTMASSVLYSPSQGAAMAMVIGAGHTASVTTQLRRAGRAFIVLTPMSFHSRNDLSIDIRGYERKLSNNPAAPGTLEGDLEQLLSESHHPQPPTRRPVERAESEIYQMATTLARGSGGPPPPPTSPPQSPPGGYWDPEHWKREFVTLDIGSIFWLDKDGKRVPAVSPADWDNERGQPKVAKAVVFDVLIKRRNGTVDRWTVKSRISDVEGTRTDRKRFKETISEQIQEVESSLEKARERLKDGKDAYEARKGGEPDPQHSGVYRLKPTTDVDMIIGKDHDKVAQRQFEG